MHAMMAFVGAGREGDALKLLEMQQRVLEESHRRGATGPAAGDNVQFLRDVGADATRAMHAFASGDGALAVRLLRPLRSRAHRFGGSHAQRDIIDLTLIAAADKADDTVLARALRHERSARMS